MTDLRRGGPVMIAAQMIILATLLHLPVVKTPFGTPSDPPPVPFPSFAFVFDHGFELSRRVRTLPQFVVDQPKLALEWLIVIVVLFVLGLLLRVVRRRLVAISGRVAQIGRLHDCACDFAEALPRAALLSFLEVALGFFAGDRE